MDDLTEMNLRQAEPENAEVEEASPRNKHTEVLEEGIIHDKECSTDRAKAAAPRDLAARYYIRAVMVIISEATCAAKTLLSHSVPL